MDQEYKLSTSEEESGGIDGYIGSYSVSIKPITYKEKEKVSEEHPAGDLVIFYDKDEENNVQIVEMEGLSEKGNIFITRAKGVSRNRCLLLINFHGLVYLVVVMIWKNPHILNSDT
ncbi:MAG: MjaI family restriction endonuclease [Nitrososphaeria archaeon]